MSESSAVPERPCVPNGNTRTPDGGSGVPDGNAPSPEGGSSAPCGNTRTPDGSSRVPERRGAPDGRRPPRPVGRLSRVLLVDVIAPLALFYGLRALGVNQFVALLAGALIPAAEALRDLAARRRIGGVQVFMLGAMTLTVATSFVTGSPRLLLVRNAWGMAALGAWMLLTLLSRRPFLYEAARIVLDEPNRRDWHVSWERHAPFRRLLSITSAFWGVACLLDATLRVVLALTLPVDQVPLLDDVLLAVTLAVLLLFQRFYGRAYLRRNGLFREGARISPLPSPLAADGPAR